MLAVLGAGDHRQPGVHGAALGDMVGDRVAQLGIPVPGVEELLAGPPPLSGGRVGVQRPADGQPGRRDCLDADQVAVGQRPAGPPRLDRAVVAGAHDQVPRAGPGAVGDAHCGPSVDDAEADQVIADAAGQLPAQRVIGRHQQHIGAVQGERKVMGSGGVHHLLRLPAADPGVLVVLGQHRRIADAQPQAGRLLPGGAEPDRLGQLDEAQGAGQQGQAAAVLHRLQLLGIPGQDHLGAAVSGLADDVGQVRIGHHGRLIHHDQVPGPEPDRAAGSPLPGQVTQKLSAVVRLGNPGGQGIARRLGRRDADDPPEPGPGPRLARRGQHPGLARPRWRVDHRDAPAVGQHRQRRGGLIHAQPGPRARTVRVWRAVGQRAFELRQVRTGRQRGRRAVHARCAARAPAPPCALPWSVVRA
jgi:hypothetical protein